MSLENKQKHSESIKTDLKKKIVSFVNQTQQGCGRSLCFSPFCKNNPDSQYLNKQDAFNTAVGLVKDGNLRTCEEDGPLQSFSSQDALNLLEANQETKLIEDYSNALARVDILGSSFSLDGSTTGELDISSIEKLNNHIYKMDHEKRKELIKNLNTYIVSLINIII